MVPDPTHVKCVQNIIRYNTYTPSQNTNIYINLYKLNKQNGKEKQNGSPKA